MKYFFIEFVGWVFLIVGYLTAIALIGIPLFILGLRLIDYANRKF